ncbi:MAG: DUF4956 domain-containing protein [Bacteroidales bacterium]|nr:DUF4956 domain-containing protein [Bacteroidales bacterium]
MEELQALENGMMLFDTVNFLELVLRCVFNVAVAWVIVQHLYWPKSGRRDYYFTYMMLSISIFMIVYVLGDVKIKSGFALGLFAIFSIIRYRTESMSVREMTYLFIIISISVVNALSSSLDLTGIAMLVFSNAFIVLGTWICEKVNSRRTSSVKVVKYDRIELITPDREEELVADLKKRTGLDIESVEVGAVDFLKDMAMIKIRYHAKDGALNSFGQSFKPTGE